MPDNKTARPTPASDAAQAADLTVVRVREAMASLGARCQIYTRGPEVLARVMGDRLDFAAIDRAVRTAGGSWCSDAQSPKTLVAWGYERVGEASRG